jgi:Zn-dependent M28 family amino/carboxypeptidase
MLRILHSKYVTYFYCSAVFFIISNCNAQVNINDKEVTRILSVLASDSLQGRQVFTPGADKAANFIKSEFKKIGLFELAGAEGYEDTFSVANKTTLQRNFAKNIVGILPGKSKSDEYIIFSAHYDHIGLLTPVDGDSISNGADDDASGVTAVLTLAQHFKKLKNNERTLVFVAFSAEEIGGYGSKAFARHFKPEKIMAMFNIEMIGKDSKFGPNTAFITGFEKSDFGKILQKNVTGKNFTFHPDPYPEQDLFYRSDNASLAKLGVPAHTISTDQIDSDQFYHTVNDEIETINIQNLVNTITGIINGSGTIIKGTDTPTRIKKVR